MCSARSCPCTQPWLDHVDLSMVNRGAERYPLHPSRVIGFIADAFSCCRGQEVLEEFLRLFPLLFSATQNARFCQAITSSFERRQWNRLSKGLRNAAKMAMDKVRCHECLLLYRDYDVKQCWDYVPSQPLPLRVEMRRKHPITDLFCNRRERPVGMIALQSVS